MKKGTLLRIDNVSIIVEDMKSVVAFFTELGMKIEGKTTVSGTWVDRILGLKDVRSDIVMMRAPDGSKIELSRFHKPLAVKSSVRVNALGLRRIMFSVTDLDEIVTRLQKHGATLVGDIVEYGGVYRLCFIRGPEGILVALAEELK